MTGPPAPPGNGHGGHGMSPVGVLCLNRPTWVVKPPIEAVVFAWGASEDHQLGLDTCDDVPAPKVVEALLGIQLRGREFGRIPLVGGSRNTLAIDAEGQVWSWGWNDRATLGHGHRQIERKPKRVAGLKGVIVVQAAIGGWHCLALSDSGQCYAWGGNEYLQCGIDGGPDAPRDILMPAPCMTHLRVRQVACGGMNSVVLTEDGDVWAWGEPWGDFALDSSRAPRKVEGAVGIAAIACGAFHNMALTHSGEVYTWGTNDYGQLGNGTTNYSITPQKVLDLDEVPVSDIAAGGWHSLALAADGTVYVWGRGEYGRLGVGDRTGSSKLRPHKVVGLEGHMVVQVAAGGTHTLVLTVEGRMFTWGRGSYGRMGLNSARDHYGPVELQLPGGFERWRVSAVTAGGRHSMCLAVPMREAPSAEGDRQQQQQQQQQMEERVAAQAYAAAVNRARYTQDSSEGGGSVNGEAAAAPNQLRSFGAAPSNASRQTPSPLPQQQQAQGQAAAQAVSSPQLRQPTQPPQAPPSPPPPQQQQQQQQSPGPQQALLSRLQSENARATATATITSSGGYGPPALLPSVSINTSSSRPGSSHGAQTQQGATLSLGRAGSMASPRLTLPGAGLSLSPSRTGVVFMTDAAGATRSPHAVSSPLLQARMGGTLLSGSLPEWPSLNDAGMEDDEQDELRDLGQAQGTAPLHAAARRLERQTSELAKDEGGAGHPDAGSRAGSPSGSVGAGSPPGSNYDMSLADYMQPKGNPQRSSLHLNSHLL